MAKRGDCTGRGLGTPGYLVSWTVKVKAEIDKQQSWKSRWEWEGANATPRGWVFLLQTAGSLKGPGLGHMRPGSGFP